MQRQASTLWGTGRMRNLNIPAIATALAVLAAIAAPGAAPAQTIEEALARAYANNPRLLSERAALRAADERVAGALSGRRPTVQIESSFGKRTRRNTPHTGVADSLDTLPGSLRLTVTQPLYRGGAITAEIAAANARVLAGRANLLDVEQQVLAATASAYVHVARDAAAFDLASNNMQALERQLQATRTRLNAGQATRTDLLQAEARVADALVSRIGAEGSLEVSRAAYESLTGAWPGTLSFPGMSAFAVPESREAALALALQDNPGILHGRAQISAARHDIRAARAALLPRLSLDGSVGREREPNSSFSRTDNAEAMLKLTVPLYQSGAEYARVRELQQVAAQRRRETDATHRSVREAVLQGWKRLQTSRARADALEASASANAAALAGVEQEAASGTRTLLDVLNAEQELYRSRTGLVRARADAAVAVFELLRAVGGMTARDLDLAMPVYDPAVHANEVRGKWIGFGAGGEK